MMLDMDLVFRELMRFAGISFIFLVVAYGLLRLIRQPVERICLIQIALGGMFAALLLGTIGWLPKFELDLLPASSNEIVRQDDDAFTKNWGAEKSGVLHNVGKLGHVPESSTKPKLREAVTQKPDASELVLHSKLSDTSQPTLKWEIAQLRQLIVVAYGAISLIQLCFVFYGYWLTKRIVRGTECLSHDVYGTIRRLIDGFRKGRNRSVRIRSSNHVRVPMVHGLIEPTIVIPKWQTETGVSSTAFKHCLAHEWSHIERRDLWTWSLVVWLQPLLWIQPFYWLLRRELRVSQDQIADEFAAQAIGRHAEFAATLLQLAESNHTTPLGTLAMAGTKSNLFRRIEMLLNRKFPISFRCRHRIIASFLALAAIGATSLASFQIVQAESRSISAAEQGSSEAEKQQGRDDVQSDLGEETEFVVHKCVIRDSESQQPIQGVEVVVKRVNFESNRVLETTQATSNENGIYQFKLSAMTTETAVVSMLAFHFEHEDYVDSFGYCTFEFAQSDISIGEQPVFAEVVLHKGEKVAGRVVDSKGDPVEGAKIVGYSSITDRNLMSMLHEPRTIADDEGRFEIDLIHNTDAYLWVKPKDHSVKKVRLGMKRGHLGNIVVEEGIRVFGQVLDARGNPVVGAWVVLEDQNANSDSQYGLNGGVARISRTDENGRYRTSPVSPSAFELTVLDFNPHFFLNGPTGDESVILPGTFLAQKFEVTQANGDQPRNFQALPHVFVRGQVFKSNGEPSGETTDPNCLLLFGIVDGKPVFLSFEKGENPSEIVAMVPHGLTNARIMNGMTDAHSFMIRDDQDKRSVCLDHPLGTIEEDIDSLEFVQFDSTILKVKVVDEAGNLLPGAFVGAVYCDKAEGTAQTFSEGIETDAHFETRGNGLNVSRNICPEAKIECFAELKGYHRASKKFSMEENVVKTLTLTMKERQMVDNAK